MIKRHRKRVKLDLKRAGEQSEIRRESGGTEDYTGKVTGGSYSAITDSNGNKIKEYLIPSFQYDGGFQQNVTEGGTFDKANPELIVAYDSAIQEEDRVSLYGMNLEVQNILEHPTHKVINTVTVDG